MKAYRLLAIVLCLGLSTLNINAQVCGSAGTQYPSATLTPTASFQSADACNFAGDYILFNVTSGSTYTFSTCSADGSNITYDSQLELYDNSTLNFIAYSDDFCGLQSHITWSASFTGVVRLVLHQYFCGNNTTCGTVRYMGVGGGGGPTNDACSGAIALTCPSDSKSGTTVGSNSDPSNPFCGSYSTTSPGVWYSFVGDGGTATVSMCGSSYDTYLAIYSGTCGALSCISSNDDFCGLQSQLAVATTLGTQYYVFVHGYANGTGSFSLSFNCAPAAPDPCSSITTAAACGNDQTSTLGGSGNASWTFNNPCYTTPGGEQIYSFTATTTGTYYINVTNTDFGDYFSYSWRNANTGCSSFGWTCVSYMYGTGLISWAPLNWSAGQTYYILVDKMNIFSSGTAFQTWRVECAVPAYDPCATIPNISDCNVNSTTTFGASPGAWTNYGGFFGTPGQEKIYTFTPLVSGNYRLNVASQTPDYYVDLFFKPASFGCNMSGWTYVDDIYWGELGSIPTATMALNGGTTYYIMLDDENTSSHTITWKLECPVPAPVNDLCSGVSPVTLTSGVPQVFTGNTSGATADGGYYSFPTVWHAVTLTASSQLAVRLCGTSPAFFNAWIILANMCPSTSFTDIFANNWAQDCGDGNWSIYYNCLPAGTYYIPVMGEYPGYNQPGPYTLTVTATSTPVVGTASVVPAGGVACGPTGNLTVSLSSFSGALQWEYESPIGAGNWVSIGGATFSPIGLTANLLGAEFLSFGIRANVSVCGNSTVSNVVTYQLNDPLPPTIPQGLVGCGSVTGSISATRNPLPNHDIKWYSALTGGTLLGTGNSLAVNVTSSTSYYAATVNNNTGCESSTRLRVDVTVQQQPIITAVGSNSPVCAGQNINLTSSAVNGAPCAGGTFTVSVSGGGYGDEVSWQLRDANNAILVSGGPYFTFGWSQTASATSTNGPFKFSIETQGTFNDNTASWSVSAGGPPIVSGFISGGQSQNSSCFCSTGVVDCPSGGGGGSYCTPSMSFGDGTDYISNVTLNTINNSSGWSASGYSDYTAQSTSLTPGSTYSISVTSGSYGGASEGISAFIDYNKDGVFDATTERLFPTVVTSIPFQVVTSTFTVPGGAASGNTRMRVALQYFTNPVIPCLTGAYLEGEDYTINMAGGVVAGYSWTGPNSYVSTAQNPTLVANNAAEGDYTVTYTGPNGCTASASTNVVVNVVPVIVSLQSATLAGGVAQSFPNPPVFLDIPGFTAATTCDKVVNYNVLITGDPDPSESIGGITYSFSGATTGSGLGTGTGSAFGRLIPTGRTTVTVTASNVCGNVSKQFRVTILDNVVPVITPIPVAPTGTNGGDCASLVQVTQPTLGNGGLFDNCPNSSLVFVSRSDGKTQFEAYSAGTTTVTWQATDASANVSTATQNVVVNNFKPVITSFTTASSVIFVGQSATFTTTFDDEDGGGTHTVKFYRDKNDASPASTKVLGPTCTQSCNGTRSYSVASDPILYSTSEVAEPKVEVLDGCNLAADQNPGVSTYMYLAIAVAGTQFTTEGGHFTMPAGGFPSSYEGMDISMGNVVKKATTGNSYKGQLEMNVHIPNAPDWRVHTDNGTNQDITWDYLTISGCSLATFKGAVRLNGVTGYKVLVQQTDKNINPATSNLVRIKVTTNSNQVIFDTQPGLTEALTAGNGGGAAIITQLAGGAVKVQPASGCVARIEDQTSDGLIQNIPNPFNAQTEIRFTAPEDGMYTLTVYNYLGQEVTTLFNAEAVSGSTYSVVFDGSNLESGIYTYTLRSANVSETRRMNLVK